MNLEAVKQGVTGRVADSSAPGYCTAVWTAKTGANIIDTLARLKPCQRRTYLMPVVSERVRGVPVAYMRARCDDGSRAQLGQQFVAPLAASQQIPTSEQVKHPCNAAILAQTHA